MSRRHFENSVLVQAPPEQVFTCVDDHRRFSSHMNQSSWMMGGSRMAVDLDAGHGQAIGSHITLHGSVFGVRLSLDQVVLRRRPPTDKVWATVGTPKLLVIGNYTMGVHIDREPSGSRVRVFIDYGLPAGRLTRWLGKLFGPLYARWCVTQMLNGISKEFALRMKAAA